MVDGACKISSINQSINLEMSRKIGFCSCKVEVCRPLYFLYSVLRNTTSARDQDLDLDLDPVKYLQCWSSLFQGSLTQRN